MTRAGERFVPTLGLTTATLLIVGSAIGSGIFRLPSEMAGQLGSPWLLVGVWVLAGLLSLAGALTFAEMGAMFPRAGGQYVFLRQAFGDRVAFLYGWTLFWVIQTGIVAAVATAFAGFLTFFFPLDGFEQKLVAMGLIAGLSLVNYVGVKYGGMVNDLFTTLKVAALAGLILLGFALASPSSSFSQPVLPEAATTGTLVGAVGLALASAFFAYDGWNQSAFVASEVKKPQRNVPLSMMLGVLTVMLVYVLVNLAYVYVLPFDQVVGTPTLASDVAQVLLGDAGATLITIAILVATFGTVNAFILSGPRAYYAMAEEGISYKGMGSLSRFGTPDFALILQAEWAMLLVLTGSYQQLVLFSVFAIWLFYGVAGIGFFRLRRTMPNAERPYRTIGYPVVPALFVATSAFIVVNSLVNDTANALYGLLLIASGIPFLAFLEWRRRRQGATIRTVETAGEDETLSPAQP